MKVPLQMGSKEVLSNWIFQMISAESIVLEHEFEGAEEEAIEDRQIDLGIHVGNKKRRYLLPNWSIIYTRKWFLKKIPASEFPSIHFSPEIFRNNSFYENSIFYSIALAK